MSTMASESTIAPLRSPSTIYRITFVPNTNKPSVLQNAGTQDVFQPIFHTWHKETMHTFSSIALYGLPLDVSLSVLAKLHGTIQADAISNPGLAEAATLALEIFSTAQVCGLCLCPNFGTHTNTIQRIKYLKADFERLVSDSCGLVYTVQALRSEYLVLSNDLCENVEDLVRYVLIT